MDKLVGYEEKLLVFVDILGWTDAIKNKSFDELHTVISKIQERCYSYSEFHEDYLKKNMSIKSINPMFFQTKFTMFSDSFAMSTPSNFEASICNSTSQIIREFLQSGYLLRGGMVKENLYHNSQTIFGAAIINAHAIESKIAKFSRVLIDRNIIDMLINSDSTSIIKDQLGDYVIDPFPISATGLTPKILNKMYGLDCIVEMLEYNVKNIINLDALQKWEYMVKLSKISLAKFGKDTEKWVDHLTSISH